MNKLQRKRLLKLASILDVADAEHKKKGERTYYQGNFSHPCGTPACALGHYAAHSRRWTMSPDLGGRLVPTLNGEPAQDGRLHTEQEFGINYGEYLELFDVDGCGVAKTAKQAAKYIRKFVARKDKELTKVAKAP